MVQINFNSSANAWQMIVTLPNPVVEEAGREAQKYRRSVLNKRIAKLMKSPEYATVATLERRKADAETTRQTMRQRIDELRATCASQVLSEDGSVDDAASEIEQCRRAIKQAELILDSVDVNLPGAIANRRVFTKTAVKEVLHGLADELRDKKNTAERAFEEIVNTEAVKLLAAQRRFELLYETINSTGVDQVLRCAEESK